MFSSDLGDEQMTFTTQIRPRNRERSRVPPRTTAIGRHDMLSPNSIIRTVVNLLENLYKDAQQVESIQQIENK